MTHITLFNPFVPCNLLRGSKYQRTLKQQYLENDESKEF